jgi:fatty acid desaturase
MIDRTNGAASALSEVAILCLRLGLSLGLFAALLFGLFTFPLVVLIGCILVYVFFVHVR